MFTRRLKDACPYVTVSRRKMPDWDRQYYIYDGIAFADSRDKQDASLPKSQKNSPENYYNGQDESLNLQKIGNEKKIGNSATAQNDDNRRNKNWMDKNRKKWMPSSASGARTSAVGAGARAQSQAPRLQEFFSCRT